VTDIKRLLHSLQNADCVSFFTLLDDMIKLESLESRSFSIFKFCDDDTNLLIRRLQHLAKRRIWEIVDKERTDPLQIEAEETDSKGKKK
jgi:hypothetical protein